MAQALQLAARGLYTTQPNPRVGCVIARDGVVVGRGFHRQAGGLHAEPEALAEALDVLTRFRLLGFRLAMDDFGTGTSTFERLRVYPFSELKINRLFVHTDRGGIDHTRAMLRAAVDLGEALELKVVVEGVETPTEYALVEEVACDAVQGYLVSRPVRPERFADALADWVRRRDQIA